MSTGNLISPHGGSLVNRFADGNLADEAASLPKITLSSKQACDLEMIAIGAFSPLTGFCKKADFESICKDMRLADGTVWPIPIILDVDDEFINDIDNNQNITLRDKEGFAIAILDIESKWKPDKKNEELLFKIPFILAFYYKNSQERFSIEIKSDKEKFCFRLKNKPLFFRIDPGYECPCKIVVSDISRPMLHEQLKRDSDPIGRLEAAAALTKNSSTEDINVLGKQLWKEKEWGVAVRIAKALGKIGGNNARDFLINGLKIINPKIRRGVVSALGSFVHDEKAALSIRQRARRDPSYRVEAVALQMLGKIKDRDSFAFLESSISRKSHNAMAQTAIYNALAELEDEASWDYLVRGAEYGAHRNSRQAAMRALAKLANRYPHRKGEVIEHLTRFAHEKRGTPAATFRGKLGAIMAMKQLDDLSVVPALRQIVDNETDGRLQRRAEDTISYLRESAKKPKEMKEIRSELDSVITENKLLRERMNIIEKKHTAKTRKKKG